MCLCRLLGLDRSDPVRTFASCSRAGLLGLVVVLLILAAGIGLLVFLLRPTDLEQAEADLQCARHIVHKMQADAVAAAEDARAHSTRATEYLTAAEEDKATADDAFLDWCDSSAHAEKRLAQSKRERWRTLLHLSAEYHRLLAEAECELLRAKDARDRGTPYPVAPRVRELLTPILSSR